MDDYIEGNGILSSHPDYEGNRRRYEERIQLDPAFAQAEENRISIEKLNDDALDIGWKQLLDRADAEKQQPELDSIDAMLAPYLKKELAEENKLKRITPTQKRDFSAFQKCCVRWELRHLPAPPQAVAVHLAEQSEHGAAHAARHARAIST